MTDTNYTITLRCLRPAPAGGAVLFDLEIRGDAGFHTEGRVALAPSVRKSTLGDAERLAPASDHLQGWVTGPAQAAIQGLYWQTAGGILREIVALANAPRVGSHALTSEVEA